MVRALAARDAAGIEALKPTMIIAMAILLLVFIK
jgi:hypothetical protein